MTTGALIFAFNNEHTDYIAMAAWSADRIHRHLDIPVAVITDCTDASRLAKFDHVIQADPASGGTRYFDDYKETVTWYNASRSDAYSLTPWDQTLLLDADYVVCGNELKMVLAASQEFMCHRLAWDITGITDFSALNYFGQHKMPMWWATVIMFRRCLHAELVFNTMTMVRDNWTHYRNLYKNNSVSYRNDHALSIALGVVNGHTLDHASIPWSLASVVPEHRLTRVDTDRYRVDFVTQENQARWIEIGHQDFHAMGKLHLGEIVASHA